MNKETMFTTDENNVSGLKWSKSDYEEKKQQKIYDDVMSDVLYDSVDPKYVIPIPGTPDAPSIPPRFPDQQADDIEPCGGAIGRTLDNIWSALYKMADCGGKWFANASMIAVWVAIVAYMSLAVYTWEQGRQTTDWCTGYGMAFIIFAIIVWTTLYYYILKPALILIGPRLRGRLPEKCINTYNVCLSWSRTVMGFAMALGAAIFLILDTEDDRRRLVSLSGIVLIMMFGLFFSKHPLYVQWNIVGTGLCLQVVLAMLTVRLPLGRSIFQCIGDRVQQFLEFGYQGALFVYGPFLVNEIHVFAFQVLSVIFFLSMIVEVLFYLGWLQSIFFKTGIVLHAILGTTIIESVNAICTVFLGMSESPLLYKPYIKYLTISEIHTVMSSGFSTVAGTLLAAYTSLGVNPINIITASIMSAPGSLAFSKLFYPETKKTRTSIDNIVVINSNENSILDAACRGAFSAIELVQGIIANLIACISAVALLDSLLHWMGQLVGVQGLSFNYLLGKVFIPLAWSMGVVPQECEHVARLIGLKTTVNEFVAYKELGNLKQAGKLSYRSEAIATFALCGFANPGSVSIMLATLTSLAPEQKQNAVKASMRAFISGSCTNFISACIVGLIVPETGFAS